MTVSDLLNRKYLEWQLQEGAQRKTVDDFAEFIGVKRPLLSLWMNGKRQPGEEYKKRLVELFGDDAIRAFGEDPDLYLVTQQWDKLPANVRQSIVETAKRQASKNASGRIHQKRATRTAE